jgi:fucose permease
MGPTGKRKALLLAGAMGAWAWNMGLRVGVPSVLPFIRERYSLTTAEASSIPAALNLGYYLTSLQSGRLSRRLGHSRALIGYVLGAALLSCLFGLSRDRTSHTSSQSLWAP